MKKAIFLIFFFIILISGCVTDSKPTPKEGAEKTAVEFSVLMSGQKYDDVYKLLLPDIQSLFTSDDFSEIMHDKFKDISFIYDKTVLTNDSEAYAYYKIQSGIAEASTEPFKLEFHKGEWRINAFGGVFLDIQQKREYEEKVSKYEEELSKYKYFFKLGEEANSSRGSIKVKFVYTADRIAQKYFEKDIKPSGVNNTLLIIVVEAKIEGLPRFGYCVYKYDENNTIGNQYISSNKYCQKQSLTFVDESLDNKIIDAFNTNENVTGIIAYEVPSQIKEFVIPYEKFYYDIYKGKYMDIYFIVKT